MLVLSFRDMSVPRCGAVTSAAMYHLDPVDAAMSWDPPPPMTLASWAEVGAAVAGKHVCFLVHGFNVDRDRGYTGLGAMGQEMRHGGALLGLPPREGPLDFFVRGADVVVPVLWAGDWYLPINYPFLLPDVRQTGKYFSQLILSAATQMSRVSFVSHSMGARVVFETVQQTVAAAAKMSLRRPEFDTALLMAAATSDEIFDDPDYADAIDAIRRFVVVTSRADTVLSEAFPAGNAVEQLLWTHDPGANDALGRYGPRLKTGSKAIGKTVWYEIPLPDHQSDPGQNHGDYVPSPWEPTPPYPNGWSDKRVKIGALAQAVLNDQPPPWPPAKPVNPIPG
jgi:hypothetical protein